MSTSRADDYYSTYATSRKSPPRDLHYQSSDKGGRTSVTLPPLSTAFPTSRFPVDNYYSQPRASPGRGYDQAMMYSHYSNIPSTTPATYYDADYTLQQQHQHPQYNSYATPRSSAHHNYGDSSPRRHGAPTGTSYSGIDERWQSSYHSNTHPSVSGSFCTPVASYPPQYTSSHHQQAELYPYEFSSHDPSSHMSSHAANPRTSSPHRAAVSSRPQAAPARGPSPTSQAATSPTSPTSYVSHYPETSQEAATKKKRRRADANQLKILHEVWERTAFPSTEERAELAKRLDMSPRSVQIWFQNKRQSLRQTNRQSANLTSASHQPFVIQPQEDSYLDEMTSYRHTSSVSPSSALAYANAPAPSGHPSRSPSVPYRRSRS